MRTLATDEERSMKFMMMMHAPRSSSGDYQIARWTPEDIKAHMAFMHRFNRELVDAGEFVGAEGLATPGDARVIRAGADGLPVVSDGPFPEAKEFLAGYWIIDVESVDRAYALAARASAAPGPGGTPLNMPIEVRQVMSAPLQE
jgi:hypothetical protein